MEYKKGNEEYCVTEPLFKRRIRFGLKPKFAILNRFYLRKLRAENSI